VDYSGQLHHLATSSVANPNSTDPEYNHSMQVLRMAYVHNIAQNSYDPLHVPVTNPSRDIRVLKGLKLTHSTARALDLLQR
jgi:hypothetical protein